MNRQKDKTCDKGAAKLRRQVDFSLLKITIQYPKICGYYKYFCFLLRARGTKIVRITQFQEQESENT